MGHYYAEMACPQCRKVRCTCPLEPDPTRFKWIVDEDLKPIQICDFDEKHRRQGRWGRVAGAPLLLRLGWLSFDTKEEAEEHAKVLLDEKIAELERNIAEAKLNLAAAKKLKKQQKRTL